jgi:acyl-CoA thioesterase-2
VLGQALVAAGRTVEAADRPPHSLQSYFLLAGDPTVPIFFEVDRIRDGRSFTTRRVRAIQRGEAIFALSASFHVAEEGPTHEAPIPDVPDVANARADRPSSFDQFPSDWARPIEIVPVRWGGPDAGGDPSEQMMWMRVEGALPDDPLLHASLLAYASDFGLVSAIAFPHTDMPWGNFMMASLDHCMWFHRPFRADDWLLYRRWSPSAAGARGVAFGTLHQADGTFVASVAQEGLVRPVKGR